MKPQDVAQHVYLAIWHIAQGTGDMHRGGLGNLDSGLSGFSA
jgi:hypothetical protein